MDQAALLYMVSHEVSLRHIVGALVIVPDCLSIEVDKLALECLFCHFPTVGKLHTLFASTFSSMQ